MVTAGTKSIILLDPYWDLAGVAGVEPTVPVLETGRLAINGHPLKHQGETQFSKWFI
jgi:hypothetical protein